MAAWGIFLVMILCLLALCIRGVRIALGIVAIGVLIYDRDVRAITARRANEGTDVGSLLCDVDLPSNTLGAGLGQVCSVPVESPRRRPPTAGGIDAHGAERGA